MNSFGKLFAATVAVFAATLLTGCGANQPAEATCERIDDLFDSHDGDLFPSMKTEDQKAEGVEELKATKGDWEDIAKDAGDDGLAEAMHDMIPVFDAFIDYGNEDLEDNPNDSVETINTYRSAGSTIDDICDDF